jgi:hypothetical protein
VLWEELREYADKIRKLGWTVEIYHEETEVEEMFMLVVRRDKTKKRGKQLYG